MANWKENNYPFKKFTEELTQEWINCGFSKKETREWLESGLQPNDADFAGWLKNSDKNPEWFLEQDEQNLRERHTKYLETFLKKEKPDSQVTTTSVSTSSEQVISNTKKSKNAKRKEKLNVAQEQIAQLQKQLEEEKEKNASLQEILEKNEATRNQNVVVQKKKTMSSYSKDEEEKLYEYLDRENWSRKYQSEREGVYDNPDNYGMYSTNAQKWLDENYPKTWQSIIQKLDKAKHRIGDFSSDEEEYFAENEEKKDIKTLNISRGEYILKGSLKIEDFPNLEELDCSNNWLTSLEVINCPKLAKINCNNNLLTCFDFTSLKPETLTELNLSNNNFSLQDLTCFSSFINLEKLKIDNSYDDKRFNLMNIYNRFSGSLEPLKNCSKLQEIDIWNTNIDSGLEYLPDSVKEINCNSRYPSRVKFDSDPQGRWFTEGIIDDAQFVKKILPILESYKREYRTGWDWDDYVRHWYDLQAWRENNDILVEKAKDSIKLEKLINTTKNKIDGYLRAYLEIMLNSQEEVIRTNNLFAKNQLEETKRKLREKLNDEEIEECCEIKSKIVQLQMQLEKQEQFEARIEQVSSFISGISNYIWNKNK